ncbi:hypothetical protein C6P45_003409 [Maudiozyma exigua]|uniref:UBR-type domain-containing protein n=1 Tax=Maudiozyma exigua TaxID=34358 RepID=A0A9P6VUP9_MAUEX|nr:hypothetical protein C6P45_003409 [Kazachstania exigua]
MNSLTVQDYVNQQAELEQQAKEAMPWDPKACTYPLGPLKQQVFSCLTHNNIGICYSCSIRCHTSCDKVELFTKRHFTCDCGTEKDNRIDAKCSAYKCEIRKNKEADIAAVDNTYGHNFKGTFCNCAKEYDPDSPSVMLQCIFGTECGEDWYHDHCIMGYSEEETKDLIRKSKNESTEILLEHFPDLDSFDSFICWKCVSRYNYYFQRIMSHELSKDIIACTLKRGKTETEVNENGKRERVDSDIPFSIFLKEDYNKGFENLKNSIKDEKDKLYIFLTQLAPFLIRDVELYEPPEEEKETVMDIISKSLADSMNRSDLVLGASAFRGLQSRLKEFLKPFAENGEVVKEEDISSFFESSN